MDRKKESVTVTSKLAIGLEPCNPAAAQKFSVGGGHDGTSVPLSIDNEKGAPVHLPADLFPAKGDPADFVILHDNDSLRSVALDPSFERTTIKNGKVVARRQKWRWIIGKSN
jgi:hypothetical protein